MKLYFYILEQPYNKDMFIRCEECEVTETLKTYKPVLKFPKGFYKSYVSKEKIGKLLGFNKDVLILNTKDDVVAKQIFSNYFKVKIKRKKEEIRDLEKLMECVEKLGVG